MRLPVYSLFSSTGYWIFYIGGGLSLVGCSKYEPMFPTAWRSALWIMTEMEKEVISGGEYLSRNDPSYSYAAGSTERDTFLEVVWRSGRVSRIAGVRANRIYVIIEGRPDDE